MKINRNMIQINGNNGRQNVNYCTKKNELKFKLKEPSETDNKNITQTCEYSRQ